MKKTFAILFLMAILFGCNTEPEFIDNGKPGQIHVTVFEDQNRNGKMDQNEPGAVERVGIAQDVSCPPGNVEKITEVNSDSNGKAEFKDLKPGVYCVMHTGSRGVTTKLTVEVPLSSEQVVNVAFGLAPE